MLGAIDPAEMGSVKLKEQEDKRTRAKVSVDRHIQTSCSEDVTMRAKRAAKPKPRQIWTDWL